MRLKNFRPDGLWSIGRSTSGLAAVEFALVIPFIIMFIFGGYEAVRAINSERRLTVLANAIAQQITAATATPGASYAELANADLHFFYNTAIVLFPQALADGARYGNAWSQNVSISVTSVSFTPVPPTCTSNCIYLANVMWTSGAQPRPCLLPLSSQSDQAPPTPSRLPADVFGPNSLIVVDLAYSFRPIIGGQYFGNNLVIRKSVYIQPRYVSSIYYKGILSPGYDDLATTCALNLH